MKETNTLQSLDQWEIFYYLNSADPSVARTGEFIHAFYVLFLNVV